MLLIVASHRFLESTDEPPFSRVLLTDVATINSGPAYQCRWTLLHAHRRPANAVERFVGRMGPAASLLAAHVVCGAPQSIADDQSKLGEQAAAG